MINKVVKDAREALRNLSDGMVIMLGGFGLCGIPENSIAELLRKGIGGLTCISNNAGVDDFGIGLLLKKGQVKKMIASYVGENAEFERQLISGELEVSLVPQGTLAERIRAAGAGIAAFYTPTGVGTEIAQGKDIRYFDGKPYLMEEALYADVSLVKAQVGDAAGNLVYHYTAQNFNPVMAAAGKYTIAEVEQILPIGEIEPHTIHTPGIYVDCIYEGKNYEKRIEQRTLQHAS